MIFCWARASVAKRSKTTAKRRPNSSTGSRRPMIAVGLLMAVLGRASALFAGRFISHGEPTQTTPPGMCPHLEVDSSSGQIRDKGLIRCDQVEGTATRIETIRDSF